MSPPNSIDIGIPLDDIFESLGGDWLSYSKFPPIFVSLGFVDILNEEGTTDFKFEPMAHGD